MPERVTTLRDMIQEALSSGLTYRALEDRSIDPVTGDPISRGTLNKIVLGRVDRMPYDYHLRAIAAGLRAPYESVRQAAITQWLPAEDPEAERAEMLRELQELRAKTDEVLARLGDEKPEPKTA